MRHAATLLILSLLALAPLSGCIFNRQQDVGGPERQQVDPSAEMKVNLMVTPVTGSGPFTLRADIERPTAGRHTLSCHWAGSAGSDTLPPRQIFPVMAMGETRQSESWQITPTEPGRYVARCMVNPGPVGGQLSAPFEKTEERTERPDDGRDGGVRIGDVAWAPPTEDSGMDPGGGCCGAGGDGMPADGHHHPEGGEGLPWGEDEWGPIGDFV